jgi:hypothetical protein
MMLRLMTCLCCLAWLIASDELLPTAPAGTLEMHGICDGNRFWMRLNPPDAAYGNQRMLELVYTPPAPEKLAGTHLPDAPFLLLDDRLRMIALNGRDTMSRALADARGYQVTRELERRTENGADVTPSSDDRRIAGPSGWDERLAPLLLVLAWSAGSRGEMPIYDLFGAAPVPSAISWRDQQVLIAGRSYRAVADAAGRLARLEDAAGAPALIVTAWITP